MKCNDSREYKNAYYYWIGNAAKRFVTAVLRSAAHFRFEVTSFQFEFAKNVTSKSPMMSKHIWLVMGFLIEKVCLNIQVFIFESVRRLSHKCFSWWLERSLTKKSRQLGPIRWNRLLVIWEIVMVRLGKDIRSV